jgi:hypothetical protein
VRSTATILIVAAIPSFALALFAQRLVRHHILAIKD